MAVVRVLMFQLKGTASGNMSYPEKAQGLKKDATREATMSSPKEICCGSQKKPLLYTGAAAEWSVRDVG